MSESMAVSKSSRRILSGTVSSDKMDKTIVVSIKRRVKHPLYKKYISSTQKAKAHDEKNSAHIGDTVQIIESRPISKHKYWRLLAIIERAR